MKKSEFTEGQQRMLGQAKFLGEMAYYKYGMRVPSLDWEFMRILPMQPNGVIIEGDYMNSLFAAWNRGYRKSEKENTR